jgi:lipopolysaccharide biosynthesis protein
VHAYYPDLLPDLIERLVRNRARPDLLISVKSAADRRAVEAHLRSYQGGSVDVRVVPNRGRDIGAFLTEFGETLRRKYDVIGHLHTKKTADLDVDVGRRWSRFLLENLLGGRAPMADLILGRMAGDPGISMAFPDDPNVVGWDQNLASVERFLPSLGIGHTNREIAFPVGTMFWARPAALSGIFDLGLKWSDYPEEPLAYDGTLLHGLERLFGVVAAKAGKILVTNVPGVTR